MLGPSKNRDLDHPVLVSLETLIPQDHFYRHLEKKLDLSFVRDWAKDCYAERGRPSIDPVVFFKLQLLMVLEGVRSERQVVELFTTNAADTSADTVPDDGAPPLLHPEIIETTEADGAQTRWDLLEECRLDPERSSARGYERASISRVSRTDPDAALMRAGPGAPTELGYHDHYVVDVGNPEVQMPHDRTSRLR